MRHAPRPNTDISSVTEGLDLTLVELTRTHTEAPPVLGHEAHRGDLPPTFRHQPAPSVAEARDILDAIEKYNIIHRAKPTFEKIGFTTEEAMPALNPIKHVR